MTKKYLPLLVLPILGSCTLLGTPDDFNGMYTSHIDSQVESLREIAENIGIGKRYVLDGSARVAASVPGFMSGVLSSDYTSKVDGRNVEFTARNLLLAYEALIASGSVSIDTLDITSRAGDMFFRFKDLQQSNMLSAAMMSVFGQYNNTWLSITQKDMVESFSGMSSDDVLSYKISEGLSSLTLDEVEEYLKKYPIFRETKDLGMSGALHGYEVMLDTPSIVSLVDTLSTRLTGSGLTDDDKKALAEDLSALQGTGTIMYDPKKSEYVDMNLSFLSGQGERVLFVMHQDDARFLLQGTTGMNTLVLSSEKGENDNRNVTMTITQNGSEVAKMVVMVKHDKDDTSELSIVLSSPVQGFTLTMNNKNTKDGAFEGNMNFGVGNMSWTGKVMNKVLASLHMQGAMIGNSLNLDLETEKDDMLKGPLVIKQGGSEVMNADVGLRLTPERFSLALDMAVPATDSGSVDMPKMHFDADVIAKHSKFSGDIDVPSESKSFKEFIDALNKLVPTDTFVEENIPSSESGVISVQ